MPWPQNAYVGQKVVCVDDSTNGPPWGLFQGSIYTISVLELHPSNGLLCLHLTETDKPGLWIGWYASRFRPVQSTKTGMSILRGLLKPTKVREDA